MSNELQASTGNFIKQFEGAKNQNSLQQYFDNADMRSMFTQVVIRAVQQNPDLLNADRTSLFLACQEAAQDRLLPDNKDGALVIYNTNVGSKASPRWVKKVQWQPMIGGLRRKLALHGFHGLRAELVFEKDKFRYVKGDDPKIVHEPEVFGDRGDLIGAYAVVRDTNTGEVYRDAMSLSDLEMVRSKSRNPEVGPWKDFTDEMYRKTMARRLVKQLPLISPEITAILARDDERNFEFNAAPKASSVAQEVQSQVRQENEPLEGEVVEKKPKKKKVSKKKVVRRKAKEPEPPPEPEYEEEEEEEEDPLG